MLESIFERVAHPPALAGGMRAHEVRQILNQDIQHLTLRLLNGQHDPPSIARMSLFTFQFVILSYFTFHISQVHKFTGKFTPTQ